MKERIKWIDMLKGYGIIFAIIAHISTGWVRHELYTFHMPLFFFASGCLFTAYKYDFGHWLLHKLRTMIVPYFLLGTVMMFFEWQFNTWKDTQSLKNLFINMVVQERFLTLWFLACLFFTEVFFYLIVRICRNKYVIIGIVTAVITIGGLIYYRMGGKSLPWNIDTCMVSIGFFGAGYLLQNLGVIEKWLLNNSRKAILFGGLLAVNLLAGFANLRLTEALDLKMIGFGLEMYESQYQFEPLTFIAAFSGIACMILIANRFHISAIEYIGKNSILYFVWHQSIMIPICNKIALAFHWDPGLTQWSVNYTVWDRFLFVTASTVFILLVLTLVNMLINKCFLKVMVGKI
ncbi:MAG: hypothetical protein EOM40_17780 [Clostridia bacterium]|nr:hypothetical protein [Clostridia bacterium]